MKESLYLTAAIENLNSKINSIHLVRNLMKFLFNKFKHWIKS